MKLTKIYKSASYFLILALVGCSSVSNSKSESKKTDEVINRNIENSIAAIERIQLELYQASAINQDKTSVSGGIYADNIKIDANWNGDASIILNRMASERNYFFRIVGAKLSLPVTIKAHSATYRDVIEVIQSQIGYRAKIIVDNSKREMVLSYGSPLNDAKPEVVNTSQWKK